MSERSMPLRGALGIDCGKDVLTCCVGQSDAGGIVRYSTSRDFANTADGFAACEQWLREVLEVERAAVTVVIEATGVYYECVTHYLSSHDWKVGVVAPNAARSFAASYGIKTKTDAVDARLLARMGLERDLTTWTIPDPLLAQIKQLCREYQDTGAALTAHKNKLHALEHSYAPPAGSLRRQKASIRFHTEQRRAIEQEIRRLLKKSGGPLNGAIERVTSIKGVAFMTVVTIVAETNGFAMVKQARQLVSYAGLDVALRESGTSKGRSTISKKGNARIRAALYMPALTAIRHNPQQQEFYRNLLKTKSSKKVCIVAVMRKLLILIYTIWKNGTVYDPNYQVTR